jgi:3-methyladenine DNA glycosylase/8-oxoguanine DNA glycosylase
LVHRFGPSVEIDGARRLVFPRPSDLIAAKVGRLARLGMPRSKATTLMGIAERCLRGDLDWAALRDDPGRADAVLQAIPGVGPWTSAYVRWRALGDPDAFPTTDLGIVKAFASRGVDRAAIGRRSDRWRPWRGFAVAHLWASLAD